MKSLRIFISPLAEVELLPHQHLVDAGYIDAQLLVDSKNHYDVDLIGPAQARFTMAIESW